MKALQKKKEHTLMKQSSALFPNSQPISSNSSNGPLLVEPEVLHYSAQNILHWLFSKLKIKKSYVKELKQNLSRMCYSPAFSSFESNPSL